MIKDEVKDSIMTQDRKHVIVLLKDGSLYVTNPKQSKKTTITTECDVITHVRNDGFFYIDKNDIVHRILFSDFSSTQLGKDIGFAIAENNTTALYATNDGKIHTLLNTEEEDNTIGTYSKQCYLEEISDNGEISTWVNNPEDSQTIVLNEGASTATIGTIDDEDNRINAIFSKDQQLIVIENTYSDSIYIKSTGKELIEAKLGAFPANKKIFTNKGRLDNTLTKDIKSLYISTESDIGSNIYNISLTGERERILSKVDNYVIANNTIIYTDTESNLYTAKINGNTTSDEIKITNNVSTFDVTSNGKYVYYIKDCIDSIGTLYGYKIGEKEPQKISSDVNFDNTSWDTPMGTSYSTDGTSIFFYKDVEEISDTFIFQGTLMKWSYGDTESTKISSDVLTNTLTSYLINRNINPSDFIFLKYRTLTDDHLYADIIHCNGTTSKKIAPNITYYE